MNKKNQKTKLVIDNPNKKSIVIINTYCELMSLANELNKGQEFDWYDELQIKYFIYFYYPLNKVQLDSVCTSKDLGQIYCLVVTD